jgi:hypothetical protein
MKFNFEKRIRNINIFLVDLIWKRTSRRLFGRDIFDFSILRKKREKAKKSEC